MQIPEWIAKNIEQKLQDGNYRELINNSIALPSNFASNDYLALSTNSELISVLSQASRIGASSSRLAGGNCESAEILEHELAKYFGFESTLLFSSGFLANVGLLSTLIRKQDLVFSDKYIHASLIEGIRLSNSKHFRYRHNDLEHLEVFLTRETLKRKPEQNFYIVAESLYSMNGDSPDFLELSKLSKKYNAILIIDEAHAVGVFERGLSRGIDKSNLIITGTCSKAFGTYGGFVCSPNWLKEFLVNTSRALIYNTALPHVLLDATRASLKIVREKPELGLNLIKITNEFRLKLPAETPGKGQIVSVTLKSSEAAIKLSTYLKKHGIYVPAIRPPTVPKALLRISLSLHQTRESREKLLELLRDNL